MLTVKVREGGGIDCSRAAALTSILETGRGRMRERGSRDGLLGEECGGGGGRCA